ncbi:TVP38/TMEM64 family protein [Streptomyces millisiae]|uniref:TVP38/TMEM64 family membrane protein n=1 Tax=Streptomyces millisiae TaxID=3075542 RepID=A0ABU2LSL4_9ACTN|nr:VTT domain-containing protein [Streptomyces sp. DSM 44918]MDT0320575.1 VTT domain-containing protein [Streptomyces sp. DSM 44918]
MPETIPPPSPAALPSRVLFSPWGRLALLVLLVAGAGCVVLVIGRDRLLDGADGWWAGPLFAAGYALGTLALVPKPALSAAAGALFGLPYGLTVAAVGTTLGALLGFAAGRLLGRDAARSLLDRSAALSRLEERLTDRAFRGVLVLRLLPVVPFAAVNLGAAVSRMRWPPFAAATLLGTVPGNAVAVLAGASAGDPSSPATLWLPAAAVLALLATTALARRVRTRLPARDATR